MQRLKSVAPNLLFASLHYDQQGTLRDVIVRMQGSALAAFYSDVTGKSVRDFPVRETRDLMLSYSAKAARSQAPVSFELAGRCEGRGGRFQWQGLYLPLATDRRQADMIMMAVFMKVLEAPMTPVDMQYLSIPAQKPANAVATGGHHLALTDGDAR